MTNGTTPGLQASRLRNFFRSGISVIRISVRPEAAVIYLLTVWGDDFADVGSPSVATIVFRWSRWPWFHAGSDWAMIHERRLS